MTSRENKNKVIPIKFGHVNIYLIKTESGYILVDTGMPNKNQQLDEVFQKYGIDPKSVQLIILTHGHLDHVGSVAYVQKATGAKVLCQQSFSKSLANGVIETATPQNFTGRILNFFTGFLGSHIDGMKADIVFDEEYGLSEFGIQGKVIHTPGHSTSSISIILDNGEALIGDLIRESKPGEVGFGMFYEDKTTILESLQRIAEFNPRIIYLSHSTTIDNQVLKKFIASH
jgi:glyoxylase-like metal-dependent hydrolase (beta-lactamase superfamily II)